MIVQSNAVMVTGRVISNIGKILPILLMRHGQSSIIVYWTSNSMNVRGQVLVNYLATRKLAIRNTAIVRNGAQEPYNSIRICILKSLQ